MILREERPADMAAIRAIVTAAFERAAEAELIERLREDGDAALSLVAAEAGEVVGHVLFSPLTAPFRALALAPVSVAPEWQRRSIGGALIRAGLARAARDGWEGVFVLGDGDYYRRFGFDPGLAARFRCPYAGPHLMALALDGELPAGGDIGYAAAFDSLS